MQNNSLRIAYENRNYLDSSKAMFIFVIRNQNNVAKYKENKRNMP